MGVGIHVRCEEFIDRYLERGTGAESFYILGSRLRRLKVSWEDVGLRDNERGGVGR